MFRKTLALVIIIILAAGCRENPSSGGDRQSYIIISPEKLRAANTATAQPRSLREIRADGTLRVLTNRPHELPRLPRFESAHQREMALIAAFAEWLNARVQMIYCEKYEDLPAALIAGYGDIIAANMTVTPERQRQLLFSDPVGTVREQLAAPAGFQLRNLNQLSGKSVVIERGTCYWKNITELQKRYPDIKMTGVPTDTEELLAMLGSGRIDFTIADDNYIRQYLRYADDIRPVLTFPGQNFIAWAMHPQSRTLHQAVNRFLNRELPYNRSDVGDFDLDIIRRRRIIRVITRDNPINYYIHRGRLMGFEYGLAKRFADSINADLVMVVPPRDELMIPWLLAGYGDIIAASLSVTDQRSQLPGVNFCRPYLETNEVVVTRKNDHAIRSPADLRSRTFAVRKNCSYHETLLELKKHGVDFNISVVPDSLSSHEILQGVIDRKYDITMVDDLFLKAKMSGGDELKAVISINRPRQYAWLVRETSPKLKKTIDEFFEREYKSAFFNLLYRKYFENPSREIIPAGISFGTPQLSPYDHIFRKYGHLNELDWRLIAAQAYQESRFEPRARAGDGGMGIMQLMPNIAAMLQCENPFDPEQNIKAGTAYMRQLKNRFPDPILPHDRICFALASYNGGYGHVYDARLLASRLGLDRNVWKDNVETALKKLSSSEYASRARYGFCRADIIVGYVNSVMLRYHHYRQLTRDDDSGNNPPATSPSPDTSLPDDR